MAVAARVGAQVPVRLAGRQRARLRRPHLRRRAEGEAGRHRPPPARWPSRTKPTARSARPGSRRPTRTTCGARPASRRIEVDAQNNPVRVLSETPPIPGDDLELTIDIDAQTLGRDGPGPGAAPSARGKTEGGNQLMTAPGRLGRRARTRTTVGVMAMATYPTYNPADFVNGISSDEYAQLTQNGDANNPLINRATQGQYAPGSTFKLVTATAALQHGLITGRHVLRRHRRLPDPQLRAAAPASGATPGGEVLGERRPAPGAHPVERRLLLPARATTSTSSPTSTDPPRCTTPP